MRPFILFCCDSDNVPFVKRKKEKPKDETEISEIDAPPLSKELKKRWSYFIRKVYKTDPLIYDWHLG